MERPDGSEASELLLEDAADGGRALRTSRPSEVIHFCCLELKGSEQRPHRKPTKSSWSQSQLRSKKTIICGVDSAIQDAKLTELCSGYSLKAVSYTHLTLPTILRV